MLADWLRRNEKLITALFTAAIAVTAICALVIAYNQLNQSREEARVQHLLDIDRQYNSQPLITYRSQLGKKKLAGQAEPPELYNMLDFFEGVGLLVQRGYLDASDVWNYFGYPIIILFADSREVVRDGRIEDPTYYSEFIYLADKMREIEKAKGGTSEVPSAEEAKEFWESEAEVTPSSPIPRTSRKRSKKPG